MLSRLHFMWPCLMLSCFACTLDASPKLQAASDDEARRKNELEGWMPAGAQDAKDAQRSRSRSDQAQDAATEADAATTATSSQTMDASAKPADSGKPAPSTPTAPSQMPNMQGMGTSMPAQPTAAAGSGGEQAQPTAAAGSGGVAGDRSGAAGSAGGESDSLRQRLIDAAIEAMGGSSDAGMEPWRNGGREDGRLSADFVKSVLYSMVRSRTCFREARRCIETCVVISQDCRPCADDPECAEALLSICGETLGTCDMP